MYQAGAENAADHASWRARYEENHALAEYHNLVNLVNLAVKMNKAYLYEEKRNELAALTQKTQELVNRRMKKKEEKPETPEGTTGEDVAPDTVSAV